MRHKDCIFTSEDDCPKDHIHINCKECEFYKYHETIEKAVRDFTGLGDSFTEVFTLHKKLIDGHGSTIAIETPVESIFLINRVMTAILSDTELELNNDIVYKRLIFFFFKIIIDEFEEEEYKESQSLH